jgi:hypothetical protein
MSKKQKSTTGPSTWAKGYITPALGEVNSVYDANKGAISGIASGVQGLIPGLTDRFTQGDPNVNAARDFNSDVLGGEFMDSNPWLDAVRKQTTDDTLGAVGGAFGSRGSFGGTKYAEAAGRGLGSALGSLNFNNYNAGLDRMSSAAAQAPSFAASDNQNLGALLTAAQAGTELPFAASNNLARQLAGLLGNSQTTTSSNPILPSLLGAAGSALGGWASGGFK